MSELQDAIKRIERNFTGQDNAGVPRAAAAGDVIVLMKAVRKYANLHESIDLDRLSDGLKFAHITDSDGEYLIYVAEQVVAALGNSEVPDGQ